MYDDTFTAAYCRECPAVCAECPQPRLLPDATQAAAAFMVCRTQWQHAANGMPTGLRYSDCLALLRLRAKELGIARDGLADLFGLVQVTERAFVEGVREAWQRERENRDNSRR